MTNLMKNNHRYLYYFAFLMIFSLSACVNTQKMIDQGRYDEAVDYAVKKLVGKTKKKQKYVDALERGFNKAVKRDMKEIARLEASGNPDAWEDIVAICNQIQRRQSKIEPLLPVIDRNGYQASFKFAKVDGVENKAKRKAAQHWYTQAEALLAEAATTGTKIPARKAMRHLTSIEKYFTQYEDKEALKARAMDLGTTRIFFAMYNDAPIVLPKSFEDEITRIGILDLNTTWNEFYLEEPNDVTIDYNINMRLTQINLSPERVTERTYVDTKEIEEGWEYVLDENGNVAKDTLGNDITVPQRLLIRAKVFELFQSKDARIVGQLEYVDRKRGTLLQTESISVNAVFENYASTYQGDYRALSPASLRCINKQPLPFPTDEELLLLAADNLKPVVIQKMEYQDLL